MSETIDNEILPETEVPPIPEEGLNLADIGALDIDEEFLADMADSDGFEGVGSVEMPDEVDYLELKNAELLPKLKPFLQKKAQSRDIITKSLQVKVLSEDSVLLRATDGISFIRATIPAKVNHFVDSCVVDCQSFSIVARTHQTKTFLIHRESNFYSDFYGGEIFIPNHKIADAIFEKDLGEVINEGVIDISLLKTALTSLNPILTTSDVPELGYVFVESEGVYSSNGIIVARVLGELPPFVIRQSDLALIVYMLDAIGQEIVTLKEFESFYTLGADSFSYTFPKVSARLSDEYKSAIVEGNGKYFVNVPYLTGVLTTLESLPEDSGVIELRFEETELRGIAKTRKGDQSDFVISPSCEGTSESGSFGVSSKALLTVLRAFKGDSTAAVSMADGKLVFRSDRREAAIILKR